MLKNIFFVYMDAQKLKTKNDSVYFYIYSLCIHKQISVYCIRKKDKPAVKFIGLK